MVALTQLYLAVMLGVPRAADIFTRALRLSLPTVEIGGYGLAAGRLVCCKTTEGLGLMI